MSKIILPLLLFACSCHAAQRYTRTDLPSGDIVLHPVATADLDGDGDVDQDDFAIMQAAKTSAGVTTAPTTSAPAPTTQPDLPTSTACAVTVGPTGVWQTYVDAAKPGDVICFHGGDYKTTGHGQNYEACLSVNASGEPGKPITLRNVPGEKPVFYGTNVVWAIRVGNVKYDGTQIGVHDVVIDGLSATQSHWDGIEIASSSNVVVRNCSAFANNYNSPSGYKAGINVDASHNVTIDHCRVYDNGEGIIIGEDQAGVASPVGVTGIVITNNFVFGNSRTGNPGNSSGIELWFCDKALVQGNVLWDNPDANINGQGNNSCRYIGNICLNSWQPDGNNEGFKSCVRGGGANVIAGNVFANNGNCGFDAANGVGDLFVANTCYGNGSWGILAEGRETILFNNLVARNSTRLTGNSYPELDGPGWAMISDYNVFGRGPVKSTSNSILTVLPPNSKISAITLSGFSIPRSDARAVNTPEQLWQVSTIEDVRAKVMAAYRPASPMVGASLSQIQSAVNANIPTVIASLASAISAASGSTDFQIHSQADARWTQLKAGLSYDLSGLSDTKTIGAVPP